VREEESACERRVSNEEVKSECEKELKQEQEADEQLVSRIGGLIVTTL